MSSSIARVQLAARNLCAIPKWRAADVVNWYQLTRPLWPGPLSMVSADCLRLLCGLCGLIEFRYRPLPVAAARVAWPRGAAPGRRAAHPRVLWFLDSPGHVSGVSTTVRQWCRQAESRGYSLQVVTCAPEETDLPATTFPSTGELEIGAYQGLVMHVPRVRDVVDFLHRAKPDVVHISTPGPMGLLALWAARSLAAGVCGTYHTDFPAYTAQLTGHADAEPLTWQFMKWFYGQMDYIAAPTPSVAEDLIAHGLKQERLRVVGRGVDTTTLFPAGSKHESAASRKYRLLYVGRVSKEKNLECLMVGYRSLCAVRNDTELTVVGDGPFLEEMRERLEGLPVSFTGSLSGQKLVEAYRSSDLFLFPSETDTYGNVVLEAAASGVPAIVSGRGGPKHALRSGVSGLVLDPITPQALAAAANYLLNDPAELRRMGEAAREVALERTPEKAFESFWAMIEDCYLRDRRPLTPRMPAAGMPSSLL